jgi:hypothetical protein
MIDKEKNAQWTLGQGTITCCEDMFSQEESVQWKRNPSLTEADVIIASNDKAMHISHPTVMI